jgi:hypothetical protein
MNGWFRTALCMGALLTTTSMSGICFAQTYTNGSQQGGQNSLSSQNWQNSQQNWRNSPDNWNNSRSNWQNSSQDWQNSPQNWQNSGANYNNANGIYDSSGNRIGYAVPRSDNGGVNYYNNDGRRGGYQVYDKGQGQ